MNEDNIKNLFYTQNNLDNTFTQVSNEIMKRTNKDISKNSAYRTTFNKMATITYDKCPQNEKNLSSINSKSPLIFFLRILLFLKFKKVPLKSVNLKILCDNCFSL